MKFSVVLLQACCWAHSLIVQSHNLMGHKNHNCHAASRAVDQQCVSKDAEGAHLFPPDVQVLVGHLFRVT